MDRIHKLRQKVTDANNQAKNLETELGRSKASLEMANADNAKLLGQLGRAKQEREELKAQLAAKKEGRKATVDEANNLGFQEAEDNYTKQVEATKDIYFKSGRKAACEKLGQGSETKDLLLLPQPSYRST